MTTLRINLVIMLSLFFLQSCASNIVFDSYKKNAIWNWIPLHKNPKVGDYAIYENDKKDEKYRLEIISIKKGQVHVRKSWIKPPSFGGSLVDNDLNFISNSKGLVSKAYFENKKDGKIVILKIAKNGDPQFIKNTVPQDLIKEISTKKGTLKVEKSISFSNIEIKSSNVSKHSYLFYLNPKVKFRLVRMEFIVDIRFTNDSSESAKVAKQLDSGMSGMDSIATGIANWIGGGKHYYNINLIESN